MITSGTAFAAPVVIAMSDTNIAVYDGGANSPEPIPPAVRVFNSAAGPKTGRYRVQRGRGTPAGSVPVTADGLASVWTGHDTVVLDGLSMRPVFTATGTRGPGSHRRTDADPRRRGLSRRRRRHGSTHRSPGGGAGTRTTPRRR